MRAALRMQETLAASSAAERRRRATPADADRGQHRRGAGRRPAGRRRLHRHGRRREHRQPPADRGPARRGARRAGHLRRHRATSSPTSTAGRSPPRAARSRSRPGRPSSALLPPGYRPAPRRRARSSAATPSWACSRHARRRLGRATSRALLGCSSWARPGVGKTRLAEVADCAAAEAHDAVVLEGRCVPYGEANVWWPVAEALAPRLRRRAAATDRRGAAAARRDRVAPACDRPPTTTEVERVANGLLHLHGLRGPRSDGIDPPAPGRRPIARRRRLRRGARPPTGPVVVVLSDLHWADDAVLDLIDDAARAAGPPPARGPGHGPPGRPRALDAAARAGTTRSSLNLDPLDRAAAGELLELAGRRARRPTLRRRRCSTAAAATRSSSRSWSPWSTSATASPTPSVRPSCTRCPTRCAASSPPGSTA